MKIKRLLGKPAVYLFALTIGLFALLELIYIYLLDIPFYSTVTMATAACLFIVYLIMNIWGIRKRKRQPEQDAIETEAEVLSHALSKLLHSRSKKPIYLMLGTKNSGRSALLRSINAIKPIDEKNTVHTDYYSWYQSEEASFLKPADRLIFQEHSSADASLWLAMLDALVKVNPRKPLAGVLICIDIEYLVSQTEEHKCYYLDILSQRLTQYTLKTNSALPAYLFATKIDKLQGFSEFVRASTLKSQVEHLSISLRDAKHNINAQFNHSFDTLINSLEASIINAVNNERNWHDKPAIISFPKQMELCRSEIERIVTTFNIIRDGLFTIDLRGLYFTSSLQSGRKYNLLAKNCSNRFNIPVIASEQRQLTEAAFFTRLLFDSHVLPELHYAGENKRHLKRLLFRSRLTFAACFVVTTTVAVVLYESLNANISIINALQKVAHNRSTISDDKDIHGRLINATNYIEPFFETWQSAVSTSNDSFVLVGNQRLNDTQSIALRTLEAAVESHLLPIVVDTFSNELTNSLGSYNSSLSLLKAYLMLSELDKRDNRYLVAEATRQLNKHVRNATAVNKAQRYLDSYFAHNNNPVTINHDLVRSTRRQLLTQSKIDMVYEQLLAQASHSDLGELNLSRLIGFQFTNVFDPRIKEENISIHQMYTSTGFSTFFRPRAELISKQIIADDWVLGLTNNQVPTEEEHRQFRDDVIKMYSDDYITYWRNAISELRLKRYNGIVELTDTLDLLSGPASPLSTVLGTLYANTKFKPVNELSESIIGQEGLLADATNALLEKAQTIIEPDYALLTRIEDSFRIINGLSESHTRGAATPWDEIILALSDVRAYLKGITDAPNVQLAALNAAKSRMRETEADPLIRLRQVAQKTPEPVRTWLLDIVSQTWGILLVESQQGIQQLWRSEVWSRFEALAVDKYPFNLHSSNEISITDFEEFFARSGTLDTFIQSHFAPFYDTNLWTAKVVDGKSLHIDQSLLVQLSNFNIITNTLFATSTNRFLVPFHLKIMDLDSSAIRSSITIADDIVQYYHGPTRMREFQWPPINGELSVNVMIQDLGDTSRQHTLLYEGHWAIFKLLNEAKISQSPDGGFIAHIEIAGRSLQLHVVPSAPINPFRMRELFNFSLPENIS
ncbi:type VI secretion system membrane subunit TssM [Thaumasiovibrio sp. DFM-14]|uniref:type VI secretion system membrane subunit TssM n=1 Tax=Thaumasiovibrio sp. DFM-14 TaxID=3384792 RepID=UPI0039A3D785